MTEQRVEPVMTADLSVVHEHRFDGEDGRCRCGKTETGQAGG